jgi:selenocysteine lyase/cysteine desulfurase
LAVLIDASNRRDVTNEIELLIERRVDRLRLPRLSSTRWKIPGVAVRGGTHCVMPLLARYGVTPTCRASFALYNTKDEVDTLAESMVKAREFFA